METVHFFTAREVRLAADLFVPSGELRPGGHPAIVACLGWGSVKELMANWGETLADLGYAVLVPDYRGFGASDGEPGRCFPNEHVDDIRAAVTFLSLRPEADPARMALFGVSYGGAIAVATAAVDSRLRAVISVVGYGSGERHLRAVRTADQWTEFSARLEADRIMRLQAGVSEQIDPSSILLRDEEAQAWRRQMEEQYPQMAFHTTLESAEKIVGFAPERSLPFPTEISALFIHAGEDSMVPVSESVSMHGRAAEPKKLVVIPDIGHHEVHEGDAFRQIIGEVDAWLTDQLGVP